MADLERYSIRCPFCKKRWMEEHVPAGKTIIERRELGQPIHGRGIIFGLAHECPRIAAMKPQLKASAIYQARMRNELGEQAVQNRYEEQFEMYVTNRLKIEPVKWKRVSDPTECDGRCMGATGPNCDCACRGKNHGKNSVI